MCQFPFPLEAPAEDVALVIQALWLCCLLIIHPRIPQTYEGSREWQQYVPYMETSTSMTWLEILPLLSFCFTEGSIVVKCKIFIVRKALFTPENMTLTFLKHLIKQDSSVQLMGVNSAYKDSAENTCTFKEGRTKLSRTFAFTPVTSTVFGLTLRTFRHSKGSFYVLVSLTLCFSTVIGGFRHPHLPPPPPPQL